MLKKLQASAALGDTLHTIMPCFSSVKALWKSVNETATEENWYQGSIGVCHKACGRLCGQVDKISLVWWDQMDLFGHQKSCCDTKSKPRTQSNIKYVSWLEKSFSHTTWESLNSFPKNTKENCTFQMCRPDWDLSACFVFWLHLQNSALKGVNIYAIIYLMSYFYLILFML